MMNSTTGKTRHSGVCSMTRKAVSTANTDSSAPTNASAMIRRGERIFIAAVKI